MRPEIIIIYEASTSLRVINKYSAIVLVATLKWASNIVVYLVLLELISVGKVSAFIN